MRVLVLSLITCLSLSESHASVNRPPVGVAAKAAKPFPPPEPRDLSFGEGTELRPPIRDGRLTLFPIITTDTPLERVFLTLQDGMTRGLVTVSELPGEVFEVAVTNHSTLPLAMLGGELLVRGHQDRVIADDWTVDPGATNPIRVFCVEADRSEGPDTFVHGHAFAEIGLRRVVATSQGKNWARQREIWGEVDHISEREHTQSRAYRLAANHQNIGESAARRARLIRQLGAVADHERIIGFAVAIDDQVIEIEKFASPALYAQLAPMVVASYFPAARGTAKSTKRADLDDVRAFARR